jgi:acetyl esterase/lipase
MRLPLTRIRLMVALFAALLCAGAAPAAAAPLSLEALFNPKPKPAAAPVIAPVAPAIQIDPPGGHARGTLLMVHAGGWAGHDAHAQDLLTRTPGQLMLDRGWRVVSIDYEEGAAGLQDVLNAAGAELTRGTGSGPLCLYGESSGAHLALVAASRLRAIDCVIGLGTPTDLLLYEANADSSNDPQLKIVARQIRRFFGATPAEVAPWDLVALAPTIHADVTLLREADDEIVSQLHSERLSSIRPTTQAIELAPGDPSDASTRFVHGTLSAVGRAAYDAAVGAAADRAVATREAERAAKRTRCDDTDRSLAEIGKPALLSALRCLARSDDRSLSSGAARWRQATVALRGEINAARLWTRLRATTAGRRALAAIAGRRAKLAVRLADRSQVVVRRAT